MLPNNSQLIKIGGGFPVVVFSRINYINYKKVYLYHKVELLKYESGEVGKLSNFGADIMETSKALKPFTSDVLNFIIKMETSNTCDKNGYLSEKSYSEDETSSIDLFSKTLTTASQDQNSSESTSSKFQEVLNPKEEVPIKVRFP